MRVSGFCGRDDETWFRIVAVFFALQKEKIQFLQRRCAFFFETAYLILFEQGNILRNSVVYLTILW